MKGSNELTGGERQETSLSLSSTADECVDFARGFSDKLEHIRNLREQAVKDGTIPPEAGGSAFAPLETGLIKNRYPVKDLSLKPDAKERLLPLFKIDGDGKKMVLDIYEIGPETPVAASKIDDSLTTMWEAVRHINSEADGKEKYPHVYAFVKTFIDYLVGAEVKAADEGKIREFLDTVEFSMPARIADHVYKRSFNLPRIKGMLDLIFMNKPMTVKKDNFREWLDNFKTTNKGIAEMHERIKVILAQRLREAFTERLLGELQSPLPIEVPAVPQTKAKPEKEPVTKRYGADKTSPQKDIKSTQKKIRDKMAGPFMLSPSLPPPSVSKRHSMVPLPLLRRKNDDGTGVARDAAGKPGKGKAGTMDGAPGNAAVSPGNAVEQSRIIDIVEPIEELANDLFIYIREQNKLGARFTGMHMSMMCTLLFENFTRLIDNKGVINRSAVENISFKSAFEKHPDPSKGERHLIVHLHKLKMALARKGYLNTPKDTLLTRAKFVLAIRTLGKK